MLNVSARLRRYSMMMVSGLLVSSLLGCSGDFSAAIAAAHAAAAALASADPARPLAPTVRPDGVNLVGYEVSLNEDFSSLSISNGNYDGSRWYTTTTQCCMSATDGSGYVLYPAAGSASPFSLVPGGGLNVRLAKQGNTWAGGLIASVDASGKGFSQQYGYFEMRAQFPKGLGTWPGFWMNSTANLSGAPSPGIGEIDIVEQYGVSDTIIHTTLHDWSQNREVGHQMSTVPDVTEGYHTYGMLWTEQTMTFYFDGKVTYQVATPAVMKQPYYIIADLGMGGGWPTDQTPNPSDMKIQFIRAYKQVASGPAASGPAASTPTPTPAATPTPTPTPTPVASGGTAPSSGTVATSPLTRRGTILSLGPAGSFDDNLIESPNVIFDPVGQQYAMVYTAYMNDQGSVRGSIGLATAPTLDGPWTKRGQILAGSGSGGDATGMTGPVINYENGTYYLHYIGLNGFGGYESGNTGIYLATSNSLAGPYVRQGLQIAPSGSAAWRTNTVWHSNFVKVGSTYYCFFNAGSATTESIGYATSGSLAGPWSIDDARSPLLQRGTGADWDAGLIGDPYVYKLGSTWYMAYYGVNSSYGMASDGVATTTEAQFPFGWTKVPGPVLPPGAQYTYDGKSAAKPSIFNTATKQYHFYAASSSDGVPSIGYATADLQ